MAPPGFQHWRSNMPHGQPFHPWGWHAHRYGRFGFGRRLFWFGFGAIAATAWARHHATTREWDGGLNGGCRRVEYAPRLVPEEEKPRHWGWGHHGWHHHRREQQAAQAAPATVPAQAATPNQPSPASTSIATVEQQWEEDMRNYSRQASERVRFTLS